MLKALIVDDEELARRGLEIRLQKFDDVEICGECTNGREAIDAVREKVPDIVFLDVQMPGIDGFGVLRRLSGRDMPIVIFVTAYDEFALQAFEANALDYLLKPINDERLREAIERARKYIDNGEFEADLARRVAGQGLVDDLDDARDLEAGQMLGQLGLQLFDVEGGALARQDRGGDQGRGSQKELSMRGQPS